MASPEARARAEIDRLLTAAGWQVCDFKAANLHAARGVAIREFELNAGHGTADYLLYIDGKAAGVTATGLARSGECCAVTAVTMPGTRHEMPGSWSTVPIPEPATATATARGETTHYGSPAR